MSVTPHCNVAGPLAQPIPTRSFARSLARSLARSFMRWLRFSLRVRRRA
jgi:hypothetical protein